MSILSLKQLMLGAAFILFSLSVHAQENKKKSYFGVVGNGTFYLSWGYNKEWYTLSNLHVHQPSLNSDYTMEGVTAHDRPGWNSDFFHKELTIPQYNWRLGYFFNEKQNFAFEINFDHTKYIIRDGQMAHIKGKLLGETVDKKVPFDAANGFYYFLNNGANFLLFNLVRKFPIYQTKSKYLKIDLLTKAGIGPVVPHVENSLFGKENEPGFQLGGWNTGLETALKVTLMKYAYLEFSQKVDYARYSNLKIYEGRARQSFGTYELILSLGINFPTGKNNQQFHTVKAVDGSSQK